MKLLFDFLPLVLFFIAFKWWDIYTATLTAMVVCVVQVFCIWLIKRQVETIHIINLVMIMLLGGTTLWLQDEMFIKWKPTVINWIFAATFLGSHALGEKLLIEKLIGQQIKLPHPVWFKLNLSWASFFTIMGLLNLYVVYHFDTDTWVNFKIFGNFGLTLLFTLAQAFFLAQYIQQDSADTRS